MDVLLRSERSDHARAGEGMGGGAATTLALAPVRGGLKLEPDLFCFVLFCFVTAMR